MSTALTTLVAPLMLSSPALGFVDEIKVTATRRASVTVQNVPLAVSAYSSQQIQHAGMGDVRDLMRLSPSLNIATGQATTTGTNAYIRGIGTLGDNQGFESAVGFFVDGVYRNRTNLAISELPAVERIEVIRGPQGTLFGKNTSAGAVSVATAGPEFEHRVAGEVSYGEYDLWSTTATVTGPITEDVLAFRLDGKYSQRDGYVEDRRNNRDINNRDRWFVRGQIQTKPSDAPAIRIIFDMAQREEECCAAINLVPGPLGAAVSGTAQLGGGLGLLPSNPDDRAFTISPNRDFKEEVEEWGISAEFVSAFGAAELTSITSYREWDSIRNQDVDFSDMDRAHRNGERSDFQTFTQEIRLQGDTGFINWLVGGYYSHEELFHREAMQYGTQASQYTDLIAFNFAGGAQFFGSLPTTIFGAPVAVLATPSGGIFLPSQQEGEGQQADDYNVTTESFAVFTHNVFKITDKLNITLGGRYSDESKDIQLDLNSVSPTCDFLYANPTVVAALIAAAPTLVPLVCNPAVATEFNTSGGVFTFNGAPANHSRSDQEWTGTALASYDITDAMMTYVSYSRGFKAGGYNLDRSGFSAMLYGGTGANIADLGFDPEFVDAYEAGLKTSWFSNRLTANASVFYEDFSDYQLNAFTGINFQVQNASEVISKGVELDINANPIEGLDIYGGVLYNEAKYGDSAGLTGTLAGLEGLQMPQAPKWVLTTAISHQFPLGISNLMGLVHVDGRWNTRYNTGADLNPLRANDAFGIINARIGISDEDGRWALEAWGTNLTDEYYSIIAFNVPEQPGTLAAYPNQPRMLGVTGRVNF